MMSWTKSKSFLLSVILVEVTFLFLIVMLFLIPAMVTWYDTVSGKEPIKIFLGGVLYGSDVFALIIIGALYKLLENIKKKKVFILKNAFYLRVISWGFMVISVMFLALAFVRELALIVAFAMAFLGLVLRVLKNVFEEAIELQQEQDFTI